ncbi:MAG: S8 family peptidase [Afipia felis]|nr:S8 family peptidase [Afipia felis]
MTFAEAVNSIAGLELVSDDDGETLGDEGEILDGHYYAVFSDEQALRELLRLWRIWSSGERLPAPQRAWEKVFACLNDLRRWGPKDRVSELHADAIRRVVENLNEDDTIHLELELIFLTNGARADTARARVRAELETLNAVEINSVRYEEFAFDALLVEVAVIDAIAIADRLQASLAGLRDAFRVRPQSVGYGFSGEDSNVAAPRNDAPPNGEPIAALFDGVPIANHPYLAARIRIDDPDDLARLAVGSRAHGTAMASLILYGDLNKDSEIANRPLYVRPFMADTDNWPDQDNERTLSNRILIDDLVRAVRRLKIGEDGLAPQGPEVVVINLSFGIPDLIFDGTMSPLARCLDWLAWEFGVVFVVSAGNDPAPLPVAAFADEDTFAGAANDVRTEGVLEALRDTRNSHALLSPAEAMNVLTVGALHVDEIGSAPTLGRSYDPLPESRLPCVLSRMGLGYGRSAKPDIVAPGGRLRVQANVTPGGPLALSRHIKPSRLGGLRVAGGVDENGPRLGWSGATSAAAAVTTHALHKVHDALEEAYGEGFLNLPDAHRALLLKTLIVHRSQRPSDELERVERVFSGNQPRHPTRQKADIASLFGFGELDEGGSVSCAFNRATGWATGEIRENSGLEYSFPLPVGLIGQRVPKAITATVCWFSPILPGRQGYKAIRLVVDEKEPTFAPQIASLGTGVSSYQLDSSGTRRGTVFHRRWDGRRAANFAEGASLEIKVSRMPNIAANTADLVPFALAVTIETDANIPIYEQVLNSLDVAIRPRIRQQVVT